MLRPYIRRIGSSYYCEFCGCEIEPEYDDGGRYYDCHCEGVRAWHTEQTMRAQTRDKLRRLELLGELRQVEIRLGLERAY